MSEAVDVRCDTFGRELGAAARNILPDVTITTSKDLLVVKRGS